MKPAKIAKLKHTLTGYVLWLEDYLQGERLGLEQQIRETEDLLDSLNRRREEKIEKINFVRRTGKVPPGFGFEHEAQIEQAEKRIQQRLAKIKNMEVFDEDTDHQIEALLDEIEADKRLIDDCREQIERTRYLMPDIYEND